MGTGEGLRHPKAGKAHAGAPAASDEIRRHAGMYGTLPSGKEHDDGDVHSEHLLPKEHPPVFHQGQINFKNNIKIFYKINNYNLLFYLLIIKVL